MRYHDDDACTPHSTAAAPAAAACVILPRSTTATPTAVVSSRVAICRIGVRQGRSSTTTTGAVQENTLTIASGSGQ
jgi:hypothetical protein